MQFIRDLTEYAAQYKKGITAALTGAIMVLISGSAEGGLSTQEWLLALLALVTVGGPTVYVTNKKPPAK